MTRYLPLVEFLGIACIFASLFLLVGLLGRLRPSIPASQLAHSYSVKASLLIGIPLMVAGFLLFQVSS